MNSNKLFIFDLDGVLINSRDMHYAALNKALAEVDLKYLIKYSEHLSTYDGLPTRRKLEILSEKEDFPESLHSQVAKSKQKHTKELLREIEESEKLKKICQYLSDKGYRMAVASNAVRDTVFAALESLGIKGYISFVASNEDVKNPKPYPEMYWRCMIHCNAIPRNTIICEDSHVGRQAAIDSGANLLAVEDPDDLTFEKVKGYIENMSSALKVPVKWIDKKLNVVIPMAGAGSRFAHAGYTFPKPLIDVNGEPMIKVVVDNLNIDANYIFIVNNEHYEKYNLESMLNLVAPGCKIIKLNELTEGAACTVLTAKEFIDNTNPLLIVNSDQYIEWNSNEVMYAFKNNDIDGGILTFKSVHPKWSYAKLDDEGFVSQVAEKNPISDNATVGIYYWAQGCDFVTYALKMISKNDRVNNEFYVAPVFNHAIEDGKKFRVKEVQEMWGLGTPEDLRVFLNEYRK